VLAGYAQKALPDDWEAYLPEDWATNKVYANAINDYYAEKYGSLEQAADSFAEQPISVALDAFAVKALLTTVSKQAAKKAATTSKMADTAKGTVMEGELASRAAAELKVAQELERTVKYEGKLVWDDALGAYVPESSVTKPAKIDAAEVAPIIDDIEAATPSVQPAVANLNTEGMMRATRNQAQNPLELNEQVLGNQLKAREPVAFMDGTAQESIAATKAYNEAAIAASKEPISYKGTTVAIADDLEQAAAQDLVKRNKAFEDNALAARIAEVQQRTADANKLARDKQRMDDDAAMAAAIQDDLFTNASPAAYENYQATRLAALADDTAIATAAPKGMMATRATGPISRTKDIDIPPPPSVPKLTAKPESASRGFKDLEINPSRVLPAAQRVAAAASQTGLQGERGTDGSFLPELPDRGIDIDQSIGASVPEPVEIIKSSEKPGWYQGVTKEDDDDGNYWSADFEDEHWNTPAGVQEAIGIWGRPVGNRIGQRFN